MEAINWTHVMTFVITMAAITFLATAVRKSQGRSCFRIFSVIKNPSLERRGLELCEDIRLAEYENTNALKYNDFIRGLKTVDFNRSYSSNLTTPSYCYTDRSRFIKALSLLGEAHATRGCSLISSNHLTRSDNARNVIVAGVDGELELFNASFCGLSEVQAIKQLRTYLQWLWALSSNAYGLSVLLRSFGAPELRSYQPE